MIEKIAEWLHETFPAGILTKAAKRMPWGELEEATRIAYSTEAQELLTLMAGEEEVLTDEEIGDVKSACLQTTPVGTSPAAFQPILYKAVAQAQATRSAARHTLALQAERKWFSKWIALNAANVTSHSWDDKPAWTIELTVMQSEINALERGERPE